MILNFCKVCPVNCWNNQFKVPDQCHGKNKEWNSISFPWSTSHFSPFQSNLDVFGGGQPGVSHFSRSGDFQMDPMSLVSNLFRLREWKQLLSRDRVYVFNLLSIIRLTNDGFQDDTGTLLDSLAFILRLAGGKTHQRTSPPGQCRPGILLPCSAPCTVVGGGGGNKWQYSCIATAVIIPVIYDIVVQVSGHNTYTNNNLFIKLGKYLQIIHH